MTEPAGLTPVESAKPTPHVETSTYTPVITVRGGTGGRGQGRGQGAAGPSGGTPRAADARAPARDRIIAALSPITQSRGVLSQSRIVQTVLDRAACARHDLAAIWLYVRDETWMHDSDNGVLRIAGYLWAAVVALPVVAVAHLVSALVAVVVDLVVAVFCRYARGVAAVAILAAVWWTWPFGDHEAPPPTAATEVVVQGGAR